MLIFLSPNRITPFPCITYTCSLCHTCLWAFTSFGIKIQKLLLKLSLANALTTLALLPATGLAIVSK